MFRGAGRGASRGDVVSLLSNLREVGVIQLATGSGS